MLGLAASMMGVASRAAAQVRFGANVDWGSDTDFGIGARMNFGLGGVSQGLPLEGTLTFDYFFPGSNLHYWEISGNGLYRITARGSSVAPYVGAGLLYAHSSVDAGAAVCNIAGVDCSSSSVGLNLIGGLRFKGGPNFLPFVEARFEARSGSQLVLTAGTFFGKP
jgi:hypothetical protein